MTAFDGPSPLIDVTNAPSLAGRRSRNQLACPRPVALGIGLLVAAGFALRLGCAAGPLSLDEIWSIENLASLTRFWQVFWGISHDNNHFLNSLWLYFATPVTADEAILRAPSVAMGVMTIAVMARLGARHGPPAALAAAALTALSYFFVNYSVEARGYAGEALALAVGFDALERAIAQPRGGARYTLAAAMGIGLLWHLAILPAIGLFALIGLAEQKRLLGRWAPALAATMRLFVPTLAAIIPALAFLVAGIAIVGRFTLGGVRGFEAGQTLGAIGEMARDTLGLSSALPAWLIAAGGVAAAAAALRLRLVLDGRRIAYGIILLGLPAAVFILRPPNAHIARYYLICALFLILLSAEIFGSLWRAGALSRSAALIALTAILAGDTSLLVRFQGAKQEAWPQALAAIAQSGRLSLASSFDDRIGKFVDYYNRAHAPLDLVARADWCARRPQWLIAETAAVPGLPPDLELAAPGCQARFAFTRRYRNWGLSQVDWALYRAP
jgi:hypothetical protein